MENNNKESKDLRSTTRKIGIAKRFKGSYPGSGHKKLEKKESTVDVETPTPTPEDSAQPIGLHRARGFHSHSDLSSMTSSENNNYGTQVVDNEEDSDTIVYFTDPNTNLREVRAATIQQLVSRLTNPSIPGSYE